MAAREKTKRQSKNKVVTDTNSAGVGANEGPQASTSTEPAAEPRQQEAGSTQPRSKINMVANVDTMNKTFDNIIETLLKTDRFFNQGGRAVYVQPGTGPVALTAANFNAYALAHAEFATFKGSVAPENFEKYSLLPSSIANALLSAPQVLERLPLLSSYSRTPVFTTEWNPVAAPGYHQPSGVYYDGPPIEAAEGLETLDAVLADFLWKEKIDLVNYLGVLVTAITMPHWIGRHPFVALNGNQPGVGKSLLAAISALVLDNAAPRTVSYNSNDDEFEKQLATRAKTGERIVVIDNAKRSRQVKEVSSSSLERCITAEVLNFRQLGSNTSISRPNDVIFFLTMNFAHMSRDLRRRNLPINLEITDDVNKKDFPIPDMLLFVREHRNRILAELVGMVARWIDKGKPSSKTPARHSTSQQWAKTIDGILTINGYEGFLSNFDRSQASFDPDLELMTKVCATFYAHEQATAATWETLLRDGLFKERLHGFAGPEKLRARQTIVGAIFAQFVNEQFVVGAESETFVLKCEGSVTSHKPKLYHFEQVQNEE